MFKFETLEIWKRAVEFTADIYNITQTFPKREVFGLTAQTTRAVISISLNIAEGSSRKSKIDFKRFLQMSAGSLNEVVTCLHIARNQGYIDKDVFDQAYLKCTDLSKYYTVS